MKSPAGDLPNSNRRDRGTSVAGQHYNWFTEGFETADLKEAKAVLDEVS